MTWPELLLDFKRKCGNQGKRRWWCCSANSGVSTAQNKPGAADVDKKKAYEELIRMGGETPEEWKTHISLTRAGLSAMQID